MSRRTDSTTRNPLVRLVLAIEGAELLDAPVRALEPAAAALVGDPGRRDLLQGRWLGHALHPLITFLPVGAWTAAVVIDQTVPGDAAAAERLVAVGTVSALPAVVTGLAEWAGAGPRDRRTGVVHAACNTVALVCFARSWRARRRGEQQRGRRLALLGAAAAGGGGFLGGHLAQARDVSSRHPRFEA